MNVEPYSSYAGYHCLPNWTLKDKDLSVPERQLLSYVYFRSRRRNWCWFQAETAQRDLELTRPTFYRAKKKLAEKGLVKVLRTVSSLTWGQGINVYVVPDRLLKRGAPIVVPEDLSALPRHLTVVGGSATGGTPVGGDRGIKCETPVQGDRGITGETPYTEGHARELNTTPVKSKAGAISLATHSSMDGYSAAEKSCLERTELTPATLGVPDGFEAVLVGAAGGGVIEMMVDPPRVVRAGHKVDADAAPEHEGQTARSCGKPAAEKKGKPKGWTFLWHHWQNQMLAHWGPSKVGANATGPDIGNMKVILDQCGYDLALAKKMVDILILDWGAVKTKCWQAKNAPFPTIGLLKQLREFIYARAYENQGVTDGSNRVSAFDRERTKEKELADPKAEMERRLKEWDKS
jgi:hypothetical protein